MDAATGQLTLLAFHVVCVVTILLSIVWCLFGYRLFRVMLVITGAALGALSGFMLGFLWSGMLVGGIVGMVVFAAAGAAIFYFLYWVMVFLMGFTFGAVVVAGVTLAFDGPRLPLVAAGVGIVFGVLALIYRRAVIIAATSFNGALSAVLHVYALTRGPEFWSSLDNPAQLGNDLWYVLGGSLLVTVVGVIVQFRTAPKVTLRFSMRPRKRLPKP